jgi:FAD/FMN-containing dehydrogenase
VLSIDQTTRTAITQPVVSNRQMIDALAAKGFAFPVGHCPGVKVSGYLLNGGLGWNQGSWGPATLSVESIKIVTSQGKLITASAEENTDYFWAARGAGPGFFGVATEYKLKLFDMPKAIYSSAYFYPLERVGEVADWVTSLAGKLPKFVELSMFLVQAPEDIAAKCQSSNGKVVLLTAGAYTETKEQAITTLNTLRGCPIYDECLAKTEKEETDFQKLMDASGKIWAPHLRNKVNAMWSNKSAKELFTAVAEHFKNSPSDKSCFVYVFNLKRDCPPLEDVAFSMVANLYGGLWTMWDEEKDDVANIKWHAQAYKLLQPLTFGHYVGESDIVDYPDNAEQSYSAANWKRLAELRKKYDPDGLFWSYTGGFS